MSSPWAGLKGIIEEIRGISDIDAFALVRRDGVVIAHGLNDGTDPRIIGAMTATITGTAELATEQLQQGRFLRTIVEFEQGKILLTNAGSQALLMSLVVSDANLGLVLLQLEKIGNKIAKMLDQVVSVVA